MLEFDLQENGLRKLNSALHDQKQNTNQTAWDVINPKGSHAIAVGIDEPIEVNINGSTGYYCGGMNKQATINVKGSVGPGVAENMMSGRVVIEGDASQCWSYWPRRSTSYKGKCLFSLWDFNERHKYCSPRKYWTHVCVHGSIR